MISASIISGLRGGSGTQLGDADAGKDLARMTQAEWRRFQQQARPMIDRLTGMANDTSIVDSAYKQAEKHGAKTQSAIDQSLGRRTNSMSPAQKRNLQSKLTSTVALDNTSTLNQAYMDQRDMRQGAVSGAMSSANMLQNNAFGIMNDVAGAQYNRLLQESQARQARRSGITGALGSVTGALLGG